MLSWASFLSPEEKTFPHFRLFPLGVSIFTAFVTCCRIVFWANGTIYDTTSNKWLPISPHHPPWETVLLISELLSAFKQSCNQLPSSLLSFLPTSLPSITGYQATKGCKGEAEAQRAKGKGGPEALGRGRALSSEPPLPHQGLEFVIQEPLMHLN